MSRRWFLIACLSLFLAPSAHAADNDGPKATSPDGKLIARGDDQAVRLTDAGTQKEVRTLTGHTGKVTALAFGPDGKSLASGGEDNNTFVWDLATSKQRLKLVSKNPVAALTFSADGKTLTITDNNQTTRTFDLATGKEIAN